MPGSRPAGAWLRRHRGGLIWTAVLIVIVWVQLPMFKGMFYGLLGGAAPNDGIPWRTNFDAALAESKQSGKPVLLDFSASWCPPCQVMKRETWPSAKVREAVTAGYIPVFVDVDAAGSRAISARYGISGIPSILIVDAQGTVIKQGGFMDVAELLAFLARNPS
ncbi:MAG: thioredoxin family protein [Tepidisphaerales bacterium]